MIEVGLAVLLATQVASAVWIVATLKAEQRALRRDVDRHEVEIGKLRAVRAKG